MPNRILRARIRQSHRWNRCSVDARDLYIRLLTMVDDFGRYEAHPLLLANEAYPWGDDNGHPVTPENISGWLTVLQQKDLVSLYQVEDKAFLELNRWSERLRAKTSQFPAKNEECQSSDSHVTVTRRSSARSQSQSQSLRQSQSHSQSLLGGLKKMTSFNALRIAQDIMCNHTSWFYDNCKVNINELKSSSLQTVIMQCADGLEESEIVAAWTEAVFTAHGAKVDNLARDATSYAVQCFKNNLVEKQKGKGKNENNPSQMRYLSEKT